MSQLLIHEAFSAAAGRRPSKVAISFEGRDVTYGSLSQDMRRLSGALQDGLGLRQGDRVGILMSNRPEYYTALLAISHAGMTAVPVPVGATLSELNHFVADSDMRLLIVEDDAAERLGDALETLGRGMTICSWDSRRGDLPSLADLLTAGSAGTPAVLVDDSSAFFFGYTSGTTGAPKAAVLSHRARLALSLLLGQEYGCYSASDRALVSTPLYHGAGLTRGLTPILTGGSVLLHRRFDPALVLDALTSGNVTTAFMVPTMFAAIFELGATAENLSAGHLTLLSNASALPEHLKQRILTQWRGARLFEIYGSTEAGTVTSLRPEDQRRKSRCVGPPLALTEVALLGEDGAPVSDGEVGQLYSRSPFLFTGYHNNDEATAIAFRDGYVTVGDLARRDEEGYLYIVGRKADVIISGGVNVYPREVEEVLASHPRVREVAVIGLPDSYWGEQVHAVVVPSGSDSLEWSELREHCRTRLARQKVPRSFELRDVLPRTASGKVKKRLLADQAAPQPADD